MKIYINEEEKIVSSPITAYQIKKSMNIDAEVIILNGYQIKQDEKLKNNDRLVFIKKGQILDQDEIEHLLIARHTPGVHKKVKQACVAIAGLGGLGSNVAISLARLGIGRLNLIDYDIVEPSNLNRQQYYIRHLGMKKTEALQSLISEINPFVKVTIHNKYLDESNISRILKNIPIIVEAFDNPTSKAVLVNTVLTKMKDQIIVAASGMAGFESNNSIRTKKIRDNFYIVGDFVTEAKQGCGLMAPRVAIAANHQANMVLRLILGEKDT